jgi:dCMP deaminase
MSENRISRDDLYIQVAELFSKRSPCGRLQVGCTITNEGRIIVSGYNGPTKIERSGNICNCDKLKPCNKSIHAEANAISFSAKKGIPLEGSILYTTHSPCLKCAELIVQSGILRVVYKEEFRDKEGLLYLEFNGVKIEKYGKL